MSDSPEAPGNSSFRAAIDAFLRARLQAKLDKLADDDPKRSDLIAEHQHAAWIADAARRVRQIQAVTHSLKPIHPDARGTSLHVAPSDLPALAELGSHALGGRFALDVVGNAAALDVVKLLKVEHGGRTLLDALRADDAGALRALADDAGEAAALRDAFLSLTEARDGAASSHVLAKQVYWLTGDDASDDAQYHLLAPLYPTSLVQAVYDDVHDARFGEANKLARQARREGTSFDGVYREYRDLAVQKLGGTKPQNISQLNSERGGNNYLLSSLPPVWESRLDFLPAHAASIFDRAFTGRPEVRRTLEALRAFLGTDPPANLRTRTRRDALLDRLIDELVIYAGELLRHPAGWTRQAPFEDLSYDEKLWLDPLRAELPEEREFAVDWLAMEWPERIGARFGKWLNAQLRHELPDVGYHEAREWQRALLGDDSGWQEQLRRRRDSLDLAHPGHVSTEGA
ncbi:type I-F CRISPR-associated protein Csy1 [Burkholderia glumae]|uniref:type I-F CRISPR-associated protein Csy1 n=1 Tax=Burkholderia glumae TaxID=337 RepID=UPI00039A468C|nr:type I-F CRISPR-associated protein Csy1 [Burkholderia glumae]MCM2496232.1 type I-F CRISPR-associated protein Csy1 [Burkholderia glumae]MCM2546507.1 type I-F CRISPR-associated protein Csy1 [Burkholderia glumae]